MIDSIEHSGKSCAHMLSSEHLNELPQLKSVQLNVLSGRIPFSGMLLQAFTRLHRLSIGYQTYATDAVTLRAHLGAFAICGEHLVHLSVLNTPPE